MLLLSESRKKKNKTKILSFSGQGEPVIVIFQSHKYISSLKCMFVTGTVPLLDI